MLLKYDFHIHSCLSPCGSDDMTPATIVGLAMLAGYDVIALTDHNSAKNCPAALAAGAAYGLCVVPGLELMCNDESHVLCLFPDLESAQGFSELVYRQLPPIKNDPEVFGRQLVMDADDRILCEEDHLLVAATAIGTYQVSALVAGFGGVAIPAHIDRNSFSILTNLGAYDPNMGFSVVELSQQADRRALRAAHPDIKGLPYIVNSDSHSLENLPDAQYRIEATGKTPAAVIEALRCAKNLPKI